MIQPPDIGDVPPPSKGWEVERFRIANERPWNGRRWFFSVYSKQFPAPESDGAYWVRYPSYAITVIIFGRVWRLWRWEVASGDSWR